MHKIYQVRRGFTLVELLVVMAIIAILATLTLAFFPSVASSAREARAATQLQSWLSVSKQRALRDQAPRGLRLWFAANYLVGSTPLAGPIVTDCQYIEQPDDFPTGPGWTISGGVANAVPGYDSQNSITFLFNSGLGDIVNGYLPVSVPNVPLESQYWAIQPGDCLEIMGTGLVYQIIQVGVPLTNGTVNPNAVVIAPPMTYPLSPTASFRVIRAPRTTGNETLKLPDNTLIDLGTNFLFSDPLPIQTATYVDILFSPSGEVISPGVATSSIKLWVRSPSEYSPGDIFRGDPTIVAVFSKTGFVGAYPPAPGLLGNPYALVK